MFQEFRIKNATLKAKKARLMFSSWGRNRQFICICGAPFFWIVTLSLRKKTMLWVWMMWWQNYIRLKENSISRRKHEPLQPPPPPPPHRAPSSRPSPAYNHSHPAITDRMTWPLIRIKQYKSNVCLSLFVGTVPDKTICITQCTGTMKVLLLILLSIGCISAKR